MAIKPSLDLLDRRLLLELDRNSRAPFAAIAKQLKASEETVRYRTRRLQEEGIIRKLFAVIDGTQIGLTYHKIFLKLQGASEERLDTLAKKLGVSPAVRWIAAFDGPYDMGIAIKCSSMLELSNFVDLLGATCRRLISKRGISLNVAAEYLPRDYLVGDKQRSSPVKRYALGHCDRSIDDTDRELVQMLSADARIGAAELLRNSTERKISGAPMTAEGVSLRIKRLEREKIIVGYSMMPDVFSLGKIYYKILIEFHQLSLAEFESFRGYCEKHPCIVYFTKSLGVWDCELDLEVDSVRQYRTILSDITSKHPTLIREYSALTLLKIAHFYER